MGVSPVSNRKMFFSYFQPFFLYGRETIVIYKTDLARLETSFRSLLKKMMSLSEMCLHQQFTYPMVCSQQKHRGT